MLGSLLLLTACVVSDGSAEWPGVLTATHGEVRIIRDGHAYRGRGRAGLRHGDRVAVGASGQASLYLDGDHAVLLGPRTELELQPLPGSTVGASTGWHLSLVSGEMRLTTAGEPVMVRTPSVELWPQRGILRTRVEGTRAQAYQEAGVTHLRAGATTAALRRGEASAWPAGSPMPAPGAWTLHVAPLRLAAARAARPVPSIPVHQPPGGDPAQDTRSPSDQPMRDGSTGDPPDQNGGNNEENGDADDDTPPSRGLPGEDDEEEPPDAAEIASRPIATGSLNSFGLGALNGSLGGLAASGAGFADANQQTFQGMLTQDYPSTPFAMPTSGGGPAGPSPLLDMGDPFPGGIHLVTAENRYQFNKVVLTDGEQDAIFGMGNTHAYWSVGLGAPPTSQVVTDFLTGTDPTPTTVQIPQFDAYVVRLDQFGIFDAALDPAGAAANNAPFTGLLGTMPAAPTVTGATPLADDRARFNDGATFALGEFRLTRSMTTPDTLDLAIRRSDQDRLIVKDPGGNDANDQVTANDDIASYDDVVDARFLPQAPTVKVPTVNAYDAGPSRFDRLGFLRKAAVTTLMADQLHDFAQRTGQTRFVIRELDGTARIIDITGYQRP